MIRYIDIFILFYLEFDTENKYTGVSNIIIFFLNDGS